jgi:hypothetical protein
MTLYSPGTSFQPSVPSSNTVKQSRSTWMVTGFASPRAEFSHGSILSASWEVHRLSWAATRRTSAISVPGRLPVFFTVNETVSPSPFFTLSPE